MPRYLLYGLTLQSRIDLAGLGTSTSRRAADLLVHWPEDGPPPIIEWTGPPGPERSDVPELHIGVGASTEGTFRRLRYSGPPGYVDVVLDPTASHLWLQWSDGVPPDDVRSLLLGELLGHVLRLRGVTCLHASTVAVGGAAIALAGPKGAGKSTLAAALASRGCPILGDDIAPLRKAGAEYGIAPGYAGVRLCPDAADALDVGHRRLRKVWESGDKRYVALSTNPNSGTWRFEGRPLPLRAVYLLAARNGDGASPLVTALARSDALVRMVPHVYYGHAAKDAGQLARDLEVLGNLAATTPVRLLAPRDGLDRLAEVVEAVVGDARDAVVPA
jgi:hypothetical protein